MFDLIRNRFRARPPAALDNGKAAGGAARLTSQIQEVRVGNDDPLLAYILNNPGVIEVDSLDMPDSEALQALKQNGIKISVPLVSQGELIGMLNLGPRLSEQDYGSDDRRLLNTLSVQVSPALRVAQLARRRQQEARERERIEQELRVARVIQQTLLPKAAPDLPGWAITPFWQPARAVSGDFYDFISFPDGRIAMIIADVTDKGVPAALVMTDTRRILRSQAERFVTPGAVLREANELLVPDIPPKMFATCMYLLLDPATGEIQLANAGHNLPCLRSASGETSELRVRGMPLGLMPGMDYEEINFSLQPGEELFLYSDGLTEAHNPQGEMYESPRLLRQLAAGSTPEEILRSLYEFTGPGWEQEDDMTMLVIQHSALAETVLADFTVESAPNNERWAVEQISAALQALGLPGSLVERVSTATAEAVMNAMEHGNRFQVDRPVGVRLVQAPGMLRVQVTDSGLGMPVDATAGPDLEAKLDGRQPYRGWGKALIQSMCDRSSDRTRGGLHCVEMEFDLDKEVDHG